MYLLFQSNQEFCSDGRRVVGGCDVCIPTPTADVIILGPVSQDLHFQLSPTTALTEAASRRESRRLTVSVNIQHWTFLAINSTSQPATEPEYKEENASNRTLFPGPHLQLDLGKYKYLALALCTDTLHWHCAALGQNQLNIFMIQKCSL